MPHSILLEIFTAAGIGTAVVRTETNHEHGPRSVHRGRLGRVLEGLDSKQLLEKYRESLMGVFGAPQRVLVRGEGAPSGTPTAKSTWTCSAASR